MTPSALGDKWNKIIAKITMHTATVLREAKIEFCYCIYFDSIPNMLGMESLVNENMNQIRELLSAWLSGFSILVFS